MDENITNLTLRGRLFTENDISIIKSCVADGYHLGRTYISKEVCKKLDWRQPNGWLKDRACRDVLRILEYKGIIKLPPSMIMNREKTNERVFLSTDGNLLDQYDLTTPIIEFPSKIHFIFAKGNKYEKIWNILVDKYHYLGHQVIVGRAIKYLISTDDRLLGAISFSSATWHLSQRDKILSGMGITKPNDAVINNSRFLILPHVKVNNLASNILSLATKQITSDWYLYYSIKPLVAETFVQPSLYNGICYKAANWLEIGKTKGFAKRGASYRNSQEPKVIFLYGLNKRIRRRLNKFVQEM